MTVEVAICVEHLRHESHGLNIIEVSLLRKHHSLTEPLVCVANVLIHLDCMHFYSLGALLASRFFCPLNSYLYWILRISAKLNISKLFWFCSKMLMCFSQNHSKNFRKRSVGLDYYFW